MFAIFTHVTKPVRDTNCEPGLPVLELGARRNGCIRRLQKSVMHVQSCCFRPVAFSPFSLPSLSPLLKLPNLSKYFTVYLPPFLSQRRENFVLRVSGFFVKDPINVVPRFQKTPGFEVF